ncbi:hypothetical protein R3W88_033618 [Solanum pinnatisectum]|uniref:Aspartic peptidase DDI1-type domain-containing protein n=1 Tax=Solanum pinnatisectum TaxID=50273 RepID=A0AAV9K0U9_9SOLN|nr:hypothetical protein R3W88_033618 [Solanum pinnatisectum]
MKREKLDKQISKFLEILKQLYINIPFIDVLTQIPSYAKFLKDILSSKRKLEEVSVVKLIEKYSIILQNKLPQKLGDLESFTIPCTLGGVHFEKALCDSGAAINLMPLSIFKNRLGKIRDTGVSLQLADQNFIVLEMEENTKVPLILDRLFLATRRAIIDVHQGQLILRVDEERFPKDESSSSCFHIDLIDDLADEYKDDELISDSLEKCLAQSGTTSDDNCIKEAETLEKDIENEETSPNEFQTKIEPKPLSSHLKYIFLESELCQVIISSSLTT